MTPEERLLEAIQMLSPVGKGTLWFVKDTRWKEVIPDYTVKRKAHPGLAISGKRYTALTDTVPMMIGTSKRPYGRNSFAVEGVMPYAKHVRLYTYFSVLRPCAVPEGYVSPLNVRAFAERANDIQRNTDKPRLNAEEMARLDKFLANGGLNDGE